MNERTREEHIAWCKQRAIQELEYSHDPTHAVVSMLSDLNKHPETRPNAVIRSLCIAQLIDCTKERVRKFIDGFN